MCLHIFDNTGKCIKIRKKDLHKLRKSLLEICKKNKVTTLNITTYKYWLKKEQLKRELNHLCKSV